MKNEENKYIVLKYPTAITENRRSASSAIVNLKQSLIDIAVLKQNIDQKNYIFTSDYKFNNPSYAAAVIVTEKKIVEKAGSGKGKI